MALLDILHYPDPRLYNQAKAVERVDDTVRKLIDDMFETMYAAPGIGLAAIQVNVPLRIITIDVSEDRGDPLCLVNPEILDRRGLVELEEGCLSVPGVYDFVPRSERIRLKALNRDGDALEMEAEDLIAVCIQHEMDHLEGKLFVDYLSQLKRQRIRKKATKLNKQATL
ncbi:MAG: peptide deformylase [Gammaproteobacteria bacterium]|nr:peptide deformylase [Gammaproteobacteria bacterium]